MIAIAFFCMVSVILLSLAIVVFFRSSAVLTLVLLGMGYLLVATLLIWRFRRRKTSWQSPFSTSVEELKKDREWLKTLK